MKNLCASFRAEAAPHSWRLAVLVSLLLLWGGFYAYPQVPTPSGPVLAGSEIDYPPYCFVDGDGNAAGFSVELLRAALKAVGRDVRFRTGTWAQVKEDLAQGRLQVLPLVGRTPEREAVYDFTFPYLVMHGTIVVRSDTKDIHGPGDLKGRRVAVLQGDNAEEYLRREPLGAIIVPRDSFKTALKELSAGQYDAVVIQKLLAFQLFKQAGLTNLVTLGPPLFEQSFCFATRKGDARMLANLNEGLAITMADGTFRRLYDQWFSAIEATGRSKSRLIVGGSSDNPPYEYLDDQGRPAGMYVDLTRALAGHLGLDIDIHLSPGEGGVEHLLRGDIDILQGALYTPNQADGIEFSVPGNVEQYVIVQRKGVPVLSTMDDLAGKSILVVSHSATEDLARSLGYGGRLVVANSPEEALRLLSKGTADCALVEHIAAHYWIKARGWNNLLTGAVVLSAEACYAVSRANTALLSALNNGLGAIKETGQWRQIQSRWLGPYEHTDTLGRTLAIIFLILTTSVVLFGLALLWIRTLQRQVAVRTQELSQQVENGLVLQRRLKESLEIVGSEKTATEAALEAQKRSEQQYIDLSQELEKRVQERTAQLSASNEELEAFSYSISHDLRAPLRAIDGYTNLFLERYGDQLDGEAKRICGNIGANVHLMQHLIDDLLAYSRANRAELRTQTVDMDALVQEVWNQLTSTIDGGKITLALEPLPVARGDPVLLRQIWTNLLGNAIKYTSKKDAPRIAIGARAEPGATVYTVQDNGAGFDMRYADKLFGVFQRLHTQREFEGTGVGLAIVKRLVHRHGGSVWAEGEPGVGATFSFSIPNQ